LLWLQVRLRARSRRTARDEESFELIWVFLFGFVGAYSAGRSATSGGDAPRFHVRAPVLGKGVVTNSPVLGKTTASSRNTYWLCCDVSA